MRKHLRSPDPLAAFFGALLTISGVFGVEEKLGITADDLAIVLGSIATLAASLRVWWTRRKVHTNAPAPSMVETLSGVLEADGEESD